MIVASNGGLLADDLEVLQFGRLTPFGDYVKYEFHRGQQMLGIEGGVVIDTTIDDGNDWLVSLNFFGDQCART